MTSRCQQRKKKLKILIDTVSILIDTVSNLETENKSLKEQLEDCQKTIKNMKKNEKEQLEISERNHQNHLDEMFEIGYCRCSEYTDDDEECYYCFDKASRRMGCNQYPRLPTLGV